MDMPEDINLNDAKDLIKSYAQVEDGGLSQQKLLALL